MSPEIELIGAEKLQGNASAGSRYVNECLMQEKISGSINSAKIMYLINRIEEKRSSKIARWVQKHFMGDVSDNFNFMVMLIGVPVALLLIILGGIAFYGKMTGEGFLALLALSCVAGMVVGGFGSLLSIGYVSEMSNYISERQTRELLKALEKDAEVDFSSDGNNNPESFEKIINILDMLDENVYLKHFNISGENEKEKSKVSEKLEKSLSFMSYSRARELFGLDGALSIKFRNVVKEKGFSGELAKRYVENSLRRVVLGNFLMGNQIEVIGVNEKIDHLL